MKIAVCTLNDENIGYFAKYTELNIRNYCNRHGYDLITCNHILDKARAPTWSKVLLVQQNIENYDWLLWIDADAAITNPTITIESLIDNNYDIIIAKEEHRDYYGIYNINAGVFLIKNSPFSINLLKTWYSQPADMIYHDQSALIVLTETPEIKPYIKIIPQKAINSHPNCGNSNSIFTSGDFIIHYYGLPKEKRIELRHFSFHKDPNYVPTRAFLPNICPIEDEETTAIIVGNDNRLYATSILLKPQIKLYINKPIDIKTLAVRYANRLIVSNNIEDFADNSLNFIYLSTYTHEDIQKWLPKLSPGGIFAGYDYHSEISKYIPATNIYLTDEEIPTWYIKNLQL